MNKRISITGASGYIGSLLAKKLNLNPSQLWDIKISSDHDLNNFSARKKLLSSCDILIHLAAISGIKQCEDDPNQAEKINVEIPHLLAKEGKKTGLKRFILASSSAVYGECENFLIDESHINLPRSVYGKTKLKAEEILKLSNKNFEVVILRKSNVYGEGIFCKGNTVLDQFIDKAIRNLPIEINGNGVQKRDFIHLIDVLRIYSQIATAKKVRSGIYNLGGNQAISIRELAYLVNEISEFILGYRVPILFKDGASGAGWHDFRYDFSKARMEFQYDPRMKLDDYIKARFEKALRS